MELRAILKYTYILKLNRTILQFFISHYLNQAHKVSVITCDKIINIAGFQQFSNTPFTCGQPCPAERELLLKVPQCFLLPLWKRGCLQGRARQEGGVTMAQPHQPNAQPSHSNGSETGKDTEALDLYSSNQSTDKHSTRLSWERNL